MTGVDPIYYGVYSVASGLLLSVPIRLRAWALVVGFGKSRRTPSRRTTAVLLALAVVILLNGRWIDTITRPAITTGIWLGICWFVGFAVGLAILDGIENVVRRALGRLG